MISPAYLSWVILCTWFNWYNKKDVRCQELNGPANNPSPTRSSPIPPSAVTEIGGEERFKYPDSDTVIQIDKPVT